MANISQTFTEGASINKPPFFIGENYPFWKIRMKIFLESVDKGVWDAIVSGPFQPTNRYCELLEAFKELHEEATKLQQSNNKYKGENKWLESTLKQLEEETKI